MAAPTLETPRLLLRPWRDADLEPWAAMGADPRVMQYFPSTYDRPRCDATAARMRERAFEIGWRLAAGQWGNGYATEAARVLLRYAFEDLAKREVVAMTAALNVPSQRVMQRLGMTYDRGDDFDNPFIEAGHPLRAHVLYRMRAPFSGA